MLVAAAGLLLAPLEVGVFEQILGLRQGKTPRPKAAIEWMKQSSKRNRAWALGLALFVLWIALQGLQTLAYQAVALVFGQSQSLGR